MGRPVYHILIFNFTPNAVTVHERVRDVYLHNAVKNLTRLFLLSGLRINTYSKLVKLFHKKKKECNGA